jgi:hypothetical protein
MDYSFLTKKKETATTKKVDYSFLAPNLAKKKTEPVIIDKTPYRVLIEKDLETQGIKQGFKDNLGAGIKKVFTDIGSAIKNKATEVISEIKKEGNKTPEERQKDYSTRALLGLEGRETKRIEEEKLKAGTSLAKIEDVSAMAKQEEVKTEKTAQVFTAPIRWTAGSLATALVSLGLEKAKNQTGQSLEYDPKTDAEKLIIGENKIRPILEQEDLYGTIARGAGVPAALLAIGILENPFMQGTGIKTLVKEAIEKKMKKEAGERVAKVGIEEIVKYANEAINIEQKANRLTKVQADEALKVVNEVQAVSAVKAPKQPLGEAIAPETDILTQEAKKLKDEKKYLVEELKVYKEEFKNSEEGLQIYKDAEMSLSQAENANFDPVIVSGIKRNTFFRKEGNIHDLMGEGFLMKKGKETLIATPEQAKIYEAKGWTKKIEIDSLAQEAGFDNGNDFLIYNLEMSKVPKAINFDKEIKKWLDNDEYYKGLTLRIDEIKKQLKQYDETRITKGVGEIGKREGQLPIEKITGEEKIIEPTSAVPKVSQRISDESIEKGLVNEFGDLPEIDKRTFKDEAIKIGKIIDEDPEALVRIALGTEDATKYGISPSSAFTAVKNQAIKNNDIDLLRQLATDEKAVPTQSKIWGQNIKLLDEQLEDDAFRNIKKVVDARKTKIEKNGKKISEMTKQEKVKMKTEIKKVAAKKDVWANFVESLKC